MQALGVKRLSILPPLAIGSRQAATQIRTLVLSHSLKRLGQAASVTAGRLTRPSQKRCVRTQGPERKNA